MKQILSAAICSFFRHDRSYLKSPKPEKIHVIRSLTLVTRLSVIPRSSAYPCRCLLLCWSYFLWKMDNPFCPPVTDKRQQTTTDRTHHIMHSVDESLLQFNISHVSSTYSGVRRRKDNPDIAVPGEGNQNMGRLSRSKMVAIRGEVHTSTHDPFHLLRAISPQKGQPRKSNSAQI